ncbi:MAG: hypothetical protein IJL71_04440 [Oscillospiraceae bacterium]|nr:hypothetical protein [Oscillospiraceae bacterium]
MGITGTYRLADKIIRVESMHPDVHDLCREYAFDGTPDLTVSTGQADIDLERALSAEKDRGQGRPARGYSDGYLETLAVYRKIAEAMPFFDTLLVHGSCVAAEGSAYLFMAKSGTGKSTHTRLWRELLGGRAFMVNDDKPLVRVGDDGAFAFGTPWDGKEHLSTNISVPLGAVCVLERSETNRIERVQKEEARIMLLGHTYRPNSADALSETLKLIDRAVSAVRVYRLGCIDDISAARLSYETMRGSDHEAE